MNLTKFQKVASSVAEEFAATGLEPHQFFMWAIHKQNTIYELPINEEPTIHGLGELMSKRLQGFLNTMAKEIAEGQEIMALVRIYEKVQASEYNFSVIQDREATSLALQDQGLEQKAATKLSEAFHNFSEKVSDEDISLVDTLEQFILVSVADWHGDIAVYNRSEAMKYGLPLENVLHIIMNSNFTKLGADGLPIKNADGKFEKGPNFVPPEAHIHALMFNQDQILEEAVTKITQAEILRTQLLPLLEPEINTVFAAIEDAAADAEDDEDEGSIDDPSFSENN